MTSLAPVIAVVGPSGVGKDSVMNALLAQSPGLRRLRRVITRPAEAGGEDFISVADGNFDRMRDEGLFALHWGAHGLRYGVPVEIDTLREASDGVLVNLSRSVLPEAQARFGDLIVLALEATPEVLAARLAGRGRETADDQAKRLARADLPLPQGLRRVVRLDNSGALGATVKAAQAAIYPRRG